MAEGYNYEVRFKGKVVGYYYSMWVLRGSHIVIPEVSTFKQKYGQKVKTITIPIEIESRPGPGVHTTLIPYLDVTKKSKRQISIILQGYKM